MNTLLESFDAYREGAVNEGSPEKLATDYLSSGPQASKTEIARFLKTDAGKKFTRYIVYNRDHSTATEQEDAYDAWMRLDKADRARLFESADDVKKTKIVTAHFKSDKDANRYYLKLCDKHRSVQLVRSPVFSTDGTYAWEVSETVNEGSDRYAELAEDYLNDRFDALTYKQIKSFLGTDAGKGFVSGLRDAEAADSKEARNVWDGKDCSPARRALRALLDGVNESVDLNSTGHVKESKLSWGGSEEDYRELYRLAKITKPHATKTGDTMADYTDLLHRMFGSGPRGKTIGLNGWPQTMPPDVYDAITRAKTADEFVKLLARQNESVDRVDKLYRFEEFVNENVVGRQGSGRFHEVVTWDFPMSDATAVKRTVQRMEADGVKVQAKNSPGYISIAVRSSEVFRQFEEKYNLGFSE